MARSSDIKTERLLITPLTENYLSERYVSWLNDPEVMLYSRHRHHKHTLDSCRKYIESFQNSQDYLWAIVLDDGSFSHIGNINAYIDAANGIADIGIVIGDKNVWGKGYGAEAFKGICGFLFNELKLRKITAGTLSINTKMLSLMKSIGMRQDGIRSRHYVFEGLEVDVVHMALFRDNLA